MLSKMDQAFFLYSSWNKWLLIMCKNLPHYWSHKKSACYRFKPCCSVQLLLHLHLHSVCWKGLHVETCWNIKMILKKIYFVKMQMQCPPKLGISLWKQWKMLWLCAVRAKTSPTPTTTPLQHPPIEHLWTAFSAAAIFALCKFFLITYTCRSQQSHREPD